LIASIKRKPNPGLESEYKKRGECCEYCKSKVPFENITRDHIIPKSKGGSFCKPDMWVFSCVLCNYRKGYKSLDEYVDLSVQSVQKVLKVVVSRGYKISSEEINRVKYYCRVMKNCKQLLISKSHLL